MHDTDKLAEQPKSLNFSLAPDKQELELELLPTIAEPGVELEYKGIVRVGGVRGVLL